LANLAFCFLVSFLFFLDGHGEDDFLAFDLVSAFFETTGSGS
jgi:hypothetical protein